MKVRRPSVHPRPKDTAETCFTDGDWRLMKGDLPWLAFTEHYFLHHDCGVNKEGDPIWMTWYDIRDRNNQPWCDYCYSEPSVAMIGLFSMMEYL